MKTSHVFGITLLFIVFVLVLAAAASFGHPTASGQNLGAAALHMQVTTPIPPTEGVSEVGSTDGIVIMGFVLVIVVTVPLIFHRKRK